MVYNLNPHFQLQHTRYRKLDEMADLLTGIRGSNTPDILGGFPEIRLEDLFKLLFSAPVRGKELKEQYKQTLRNPKLISAVVQISEAFQNKT